MSICAGGVFLGYLLIRLCCLRLSSPPFFLVLRLYGDTVCLTYSTSLSLLSTFLFFFLLPMSRFSSSIFYCAIIVCLPSTELRLSVLTLFVIFHWIVQTRSLVYNIVLVDLNLQPASFSPERYKLIWTAEHDASVDRWKPH